MLLAVTAACAPKAPTPAEMVAAADALDKEFLATFNRGDIDGLMATYWKSPDLVSIGLDGGGMNWEAAKAGWGEVFKTMPGVQLEFLSAHNIVEGTAVLGWGTFRMTVPVEGGPPQVMEGRFSDVKALRDGKWVYVMDHASVPLLPPPPAPQHATR
jgi:ketosteroid isomerase-like protein